MPVKPDRGPNSTPFPFCPDGGVALTVDNSGATREALVGAGEQALITNLSADTDAFVEFGDDTVEATVASLAIPFRTQVLVTIPTLTTGRATHVAGVVVVSGTPADLQVSTGWGA